LTGRLPGGVISARESGETDGSAEAGAEVITLTYEVFEEDRPSYLPSYLMSGFLLVAVVSVANRVPLWPLSVAHVFLVVWFGVLYYWIILNARQQKLFRSYRLSVTADTYRHSFRYAVAEATHVEMPLSEITEVRVAADEPRRIEVTGVSESDVYFLPRSADLEQLVAAIKAGNPAVRVTAEPGAAPDRRGT
jgi:hypothetical protein